MFSRSDRKNQAQPLQTAYLSSGISSADNVDALLFNAMLYGMMTGIFLGASFSLAVCVWLLPCGGITLPLLPMIVPIFSMIGLIAGAMIAFSAAAITLFITLKMSQYRDQKNLQVPVPQTAYQHRSAAPQQTTCFLDKCYAFFNQPFLSSPPLTNDPVKMANKVKASGCGYNYRWGC